MSSSISSATSQPQFVQVQQNNAKTDATKTNPPSTNPQPAQPTTAQSSLQAVATVSANTVPKSRFFRNNDGTFGPGHTALAPFNPLKPSTQTSTEPQSSPEAGVNVKI